eukprot:scaffold105107_cov25-Tisochrysis_lutea.AAC.6
MTKTGCKHKLAIEDHDRRADEATKLKKPTLRHHFSLHDDIFDVCATASTRTRRAHVGAKWRVRQPCSWRERRHVQREPCVDAASEPPTSLLRTTADPKVFSRNRHGMCFNSIRKDSIEVACAARMSVPLDSFV